MLERISLPSTTPTKKLTNKRETKMKGASFFLFIYLDLQTFKQIYNWFFVENLTLFKKKKTWDFSVPFNLH